MKIKLCSKEEFEKKEDFFSTWKIDENNKITNEEYKPLATIYRQIEKIMKEKYPELYEQFDYFHNAITLPKDARWPNEYYYIAVFYVTGRSEGHYVHVDVLKNDNTYENLLLGKTFCGKEVAAKMAKVIAEILEV